MIVALRFLAIRTTTKNRLLANGYKRRIDLFTFIAISRG